MRRKISVKSDNLIVHIRPESKSRSDLAGGGSESTIVTPEQARGKAAMAEQPYAAIRRGKAKPGMAAEFAVRVKAGALPAMRKMASKVII
jgi:hypothetical protein